MRGRNCSMWAGLILVAFIAFVCTADVSFADSVLIYVGTPVVTEITSTDYSWAYTLSVDQSGSSHNVNLREGDGLVLYDFAGFTGSWAISGATGALADFSGSNVFETSDLKSNDLDSFNDFTGNGPVTATVQTYVNTQAAGALNGFSDNGNINNLTFQYKGANESITASGPNVGSATLTVYSTYGASVMSVYGSITDGNSDTWKNDVNAGAVKVAEAGLLSSPPPVALPKTSWSLIGFMGLIGLTWIGTSRRNKQRSAG